MIDIDLLLAATKKQVVALVDDLRSVSATDPEASAHVATEYQSARGAGRTAFGQAEWAEGLYAQVAVAWVLGCVFVRFCEDNNLIEDPLLGGPGIRTQVALDHRAEHLRANPADDDRHWLRQVFGRLRDLPATGEIFGQHNPIWADDLTPSADAARKLREELTRLDPETGDLRHDFTDPAWDTRFLGDLYEDLSDYAKKTYALLQTPIFVEEFILDRTLEPAVATFGLAHTTIIDPTCGSGHFLLGAFARLFARWIELEPSTNRRELVRRALGAIGGIDLNPHAASIARFRLLVVALRSGGDVHLAGAPSYELNIAVGDSLLHGDPPGQLPGMHTPGEEETLVSNHGYASEDFELVRELIQRRWSAVVGNPPYIVVRDPAINAAYRARFRSCYRQYSLVVPFIERFWQLAGANERPEFAGFVGLICANSFMKREFGKVLIEDWMPRNDLTHLIDSSGAYIPGHTTPTVILLGRNRPPHDQRVRAVMGIRGEPVKPADPERGEVWSRIVEQIDTPGSKSVYVSVSDLDRARLRTHPWSIGGGGASEMKERLDGDRAKLSSRIDDIGYGAVTREDDVFRIGAEAATRLGISDQHIRSLVVGEEVRDWCIEDTVGAIWPYDSASLGAEFDTFEQRALWPWMRQLSERVAYGSTQLARGLQWWEYSMFFADRFRNGRSITFAFVGTHNHFVFDRGGRVFKQTAPIIKLDPESPDSEFYGLTALLNSSAACFWLKQVCACKGNGGIKGGIKGNVWDRGWEFDGTKMSSLPIPSVLPVQSGELLDSLARRLVGASPTDALTDGVGGLERLQEVEVVATDLRSKLISAQEHLDWECYALYGLTDETLVSDREHEVGLALGERAFEIVLARRVERGEEQTAWFARHGSTPITELPSHWPSFYRDLVERRIDAIENDGGVALFESSEYKRRWSPPNWADRVSSELRKWLLSRLESRRYWPESAAITTVARLATVARADEDLLVVARVYAGRDDLDLAALIGELVGRESVAYLAAHRYTESGFRKHGEWLRTWEAQRRQDRSEGVETIPVPSKYVKPDFAEFGWEHRGRLDVPKERFISYPGAERETDASIVVGWAGWNHLDRARALAAWYLQARRDGRDSAHLTPLLAGLAELVPWLKQWHDEPNPDPALDRPGTQIEALVEAEMRSLGLTIHELSSWRPEKRRSGRLRKASA